MTDEGSQDSEDPAARAALRARMVLAIADYMQSGADPKRLKPTIVAQFPEVPTTTAYRWIQAAMKSGAAGRAMLDDQRGAAGALEHGAAAGAALAVPRGTITSIPMMSMLMLGIESIEGVLLYARGDDPKKPRNPKLTLTAAQALTRSMETALELHAALTQAKRLDDFHEALIAAIGEESPETAARIVGKLTALTGQLGV